MLGVKLHLLPLVTETDLCSHFPLTYQGQGCTLASHLLYAGQSNIVVWFQRKNNNVGHTSGGDLHQQISLGVRGLF